jgi:hypothetical protein
VDELAALHDATFVMLEVDWASGELRFRFATPAGAACLHARRFSELECPRLHPWGPSVSVNRATAGSAERGVRLTIEMQSGDVIEACAEDFVVERAADQFSHSK